MKLKFTLLAFLLFLFNLPHLMGQDIQGNWFWTSEITAFSRSDNQRVLDNLDQNRNWEWRNRLGIKVGGQTFLGIMGSIRNYQYGENLTVEHGGYATTDYTYDLKNTLWATGPFVTRFFTINPRLSLQATAYGTVEQGKGRYIVDLVNFWCASCLEHNSFFVDPRGEKENLEFRERNYYAGLDLGASYYMTPNLALQAGVNLIQYENFRNSSVDGATPVDLGQEVNRDIFQEGNGFSSLLDRPVFHLGILVLLGR